MEEFQQRYEGPNQPVVIADAARDWPALRKWTRPYLLQAFAGREVRGRGCRRGGGWGIQMWTSVCLHNVDFHLFVSYITIKEVFL